ncbi:unnamed protein product [Lactuca virosa]|uniref:Uncharacterized protein n=1 Tax=Lactuca virosa TaxID=75947 RepID=A0AAU9PD52_9ASTR|nr:unnamed protein product [Lactuca virosa]
MSSSVCLLALSLLLVIGNYDHVRFFVYGVVDEYGRDDFPAEFVFGAGTSAYQVEGAVLEDGRSLSIWDTFVHSGFPLYNGPNGDIACDGYHKYKEDIELMADTGLEAFRFSISWSRLIPNGRGSINVKGLQFYNDFINRLIGHGIQPHVTLNHFDLPQILEDEYRGWLSRKSVKDFVAYADVCFREFGDRVSHWTTLNEPNALALGGYDVGVTPPGRCSFPFGEFNCSEGDSTTEPYLAAHHMLLAHASAVRLYWEKYSVVQHGSVGMDLMATWFEPYTNTIEDIKATERVMAFNLGWFLNPLVNGEYPKIMKKNAGNRIPTFTKLESETIKGSFDFIGINHYGIAYVKDHPSSLEMDNRDAIEDTAATLIYSGGEIIPSQFPVIPLTLQKLLNFLKDEYGNPSVYIHENGQVQQHNGSLIDTPRVEYLHAYIGSVLDALRNGSNTHGYFVWSFLDLFEMDGYNSSFGMYYVDRDDKELTRYPKLSSQWYGNFLKGKNPKCINLDMKVKDSFYS